MFPVFRRIKVKEMGTEGTAKLMQAGRELVCWPCPPNHRRGDMGCWPRPRAVVIAASLMLGGLVVTCW